VTEEPVPGWLRIEKEGSEPWYKSPAPKTVIRTPRMLKDYLDKEHSLGKQLDVSENKFTFKRMFGGRKKVGVLVIESERLSTTLETDNVCLQLTVVTNSAGQDVENASSDFQLIVF